MQHLRTAGPLALVILLSMAMLAGCSSLPWRAAALPELPLLPPAELGQQWQLTQSVTLTPLRPVSGQVPQTLLAAWSVNREHLHLAGLTPAGQTLLTLSYDGNTLSSQISPLLPPEVSPRDILVQLQLSYWPLDSITRALAGTPWHMRQQGEVRELWLQQRRVLTIHRSADTTLGHSDSGALESISLTHHLMQYQLQIHTLSREAIDSVDHPDTSAALSRKP